MVDPLTALAIRGGSAAALAVGKKLAQKISFRWRVLKQMRKEVGFDFPQITAFVWLKVLDQQALAQPPEVGAVNLAMSLDSQLAANPSWVADSAHHSKALELIEALYKAIIRVSVPADSEALRDQWSTARHETLLERLIADLSIPAMISPQDRSTIMLKESQSRTQVRLASFGIRAAQVADFLPAAREIDLEVSPGEIKTIVGAFGAGKSQLAESWFSEVALAMAVNPSAQYPIWIHASELSAQSLEAAVRSRISETQLLERGAAVVVDGLDEIAARGAARAIDQARVLTRTLSKTSVLLTCRPGVLPASNDDFPAVELEEDQALQLIERISGTTRTTWAWNPALVDAIRRPFFAIAAGVLLSEGLAPRGEADLILRLVQRALSTPTSTQTAVQSTELWTLLIKLAVGSLEPDSFDDGLSFVERERVRSTTLTYILPDGRAEFSLPIFQQWFAAQAVIGNPDLLTDAMGSPEGFDRWRWALAIACISAEASALDTLLQRSFEANPGAAAWLLARISEGHRWYRDGDSPAIDVATAGDRLLFATRSWIGGIGPLATKAFPISSETQRIALGVTATSRAVSVGWSSTVPANDSVVPLPDSVSPFVASDDGWRFERSGPVAEGIEWPWVLVKDRVASSILPMLEQDPLLGREGGVWHVESQYRAARLLTDQTSVFFPPIPIQSILNAGAPLLGELARRGLDPRFSWWGSGRRRVRMDIVGDLLESVNTIASGELVRPYPAPDFDLAVVPKRSPSSLFTDSLLMDFFASALGAACEAYDQVVQTQLARFAWSLGASASLPFGVIADVKYSANPLFGSFRNAHLSWTRVSQRLVTELAGEVTSPTILSANGRALVRMAANEAENADWVDEIVRTRVATDSEWTSGPFRSWGHRSSIEDRSTYTRPASAFAADWVWSDFDRFDLRDGAFPQLDR